MNIATPGTLEWILLVIVGMLAGSINAIKSCERTGLNSHQVALIWTVELLTALFVTSTTFLVLHGFMPLLIALLSGYFPSAEKVNIPVMALIGLSGWVTHVGLWNLLQLVRGIRERRKTS